MGFPMAASLRVPDRIAWFELAGARPFLRLDLSLIFFIAAGLTILSSNSVTMAIGQSLMPKNLGMASGVILGCVTGIGGIGTAILGLVADKWLILFTL